MDSSFFDLESALCGAECDVGTFVTVDDDAAAGPDAVGSAAAATPSWREKRVKMIFNMILEKEDENGCDSPLFRPRPAPLPNFSLMFN